MSLLSNCLEGATFSERSLGKIFDPNTDKIDGVKPPARRGYSAYASESDIYNYSIVNSGLSGFG